MRYRSSQKSDTDHAIRASLRTMAAMLAAILLFSVSGYAQGIFQLVGNAALTGPERYRLTTSAKWQAGSIWHTRKINLQESFDLQLALNFGSRDWDGADGMVFILQPVSTTIGATGGDIGFGGVKPSLGVEFDTYMNPELNDPILDHIAIEKNGDVNHRNSNRLAGPVNALPSGGNIEDGKDHRVRITWDADNKELKVYFDCALRLSYKADIVKDIFNNSPWVYWGFSSATGNATNEHTVSLLYTDLLPTTTDTIICKGQTIQLYADGGVSYEWTPADGLDNSKSATPKATPLKSTMYTVKVTDICGNTWEENTWVGINDPASLNLGPDRKICHGQTLKLKAGEMGGEFLWSDGSRGHELEVSKAGTYWVKAGSGSCMASDTIQIEYASPKVDLGPDKFICPGKTVLLDAGPGYISHTWQDGSSGRYFLADKAGTYWVSVSTPDCHDADTVTVTYANPQVELGDNKTLCNGQAALLDAGGEFQTYLWQDGSTDRHFTAKESGKYWVRVGMGDCFASDTVEFVFRKITMPDLGEDRTMCGNRAIILDAGPGYDSYRWQDNSTQRYFLADKTGTYKVQVTADGCQAMDSVNIFIHELPDASLGPDTAICLLAGLKVELNPQFTEVLWQDGSTEQNRLIKTPGVYWYRGITEHGCEAGDTIVISEKKPAAVYIPTAFSPNADGTNDRFQITGLENTIFELQIFNRWGELVYKYNNPEQGTWDGRFKGMHVPEGVYFYMLSVRDCSSTDYYFKGSVMVVR